MQNSTYDPTMVSDFEKTKLQFNGQKAHSTCPAGGTVNIDIALTDDHLLTGSSVNLVGENPADEIKFQIIHPNGTTILNQFIDWYAKSFEKDLSYPAKIPAGLIIRLVYISNGTAPVEIYINHDLHKVLI